MMIFGIDRFKSIIDEVSMLPVTAEEKAKIAHKEAFDMAGLWTNGGYAVPRVWEFLEVFRKSPSPRTYKWTSGNLSLTIIIDTEKITVSIGGISGITTIPQEMINAALAKGEEKSIVMELCYYVYGEICSSQDITKEFMREISCCLSTAKISGDPVDIYFIPEACIVPVEVHVDISVEKDETAYTAIQNGEVKSVQLELF